MIHKKRINNCLINLLTLTPLFIIYCLSIPVALPDFDAGEFAVIAAKGGIAHPPGYPLLSLIFQFAALFQGIAGLIPVLSLVSVLCTTGGAILLYHIIYEQTQSHSATAFGIYGTFLSVTVWRAATAVEPFGLNLLLASLCLYTFWKILKMQSNILPDEKGRWFFLSGTVFGLAFCNHHSLAFFLPFAAIAWWFGSGRKFRSFLWFAAGSLSGLLPLLYFFSDLARGPYIWGDWNQPFRQLIVHLFRMDYGTFSLMANPEGHWYNGLILFLSTLPLALSGIFLMAAVAGVFFLFQFLRQKGHHSKEGVIFYIGLGLTFFLTGVVFVAMMKTGQQSWQKAISERFFALPIILLCFPIAFSGLWLHEIWMKYGRTGRWGIPFLFSAFILFHGMLQWPASERGNEVFYEAHIRNISSIVEDNAVIVTYSDSSYFGLLYGQHVLNLKPKVALLQIGLWNHDWFQAQFYEKNGLPKKNHTGTLALPSAISRIMDVRPLYALDFNEEIKPLLESAYPVGPLLRVKRSSEDIPSPFALFQLNRQLFENHLSLPDIEGTTYFNDWEGSLLKYYQRPWDILERTFQKYGHEQLAGRSAEIGNQFRTGK